MKKILIDAVSLLSPLTGIGRYTYEVSKRVVAQRSYDIFFNYGYHSKELYGLLGKPSQKEQQTKKLQKFLKKIPFLKKLSRYFYIYITKFYRAKYDIYFQPNFIPNPNIKAARVICTVHDFSFLLQPHWHTKELVEYYNKNFFKYIKKADHIITGSNFTKQEIINYLGIDAKNITVIYHGVNHDIYKPYPRVALQETKTKFKLPSDFLLFVGSIEPRKNLLTLLRAYNLLTPAQKQELPLILVGFSGWENKEIMQELQKDKENISYLGFVSDEELAHIYNLCTIFIYPSLYEGFGLPPLEAMACSTPVIVSNVASLPEVCGDAAIYIDPHNEENIKDSILILFNDKDLRDTLSQKAISQAASFSWEKSAAMHIEVFEKL